MVFSKIPVFQIENKRLRTRQVTKAACRQDQSRLGFSTKSTVDTMKDFSILGSLFRPHIWAIKYHESTAIFLFHAGKKLVFGSFAWCNLLVVCKWRRWSDGNFELICGGTASVWNAALQLKAARYAGKAGKKARIFISRWRRSVWSLKTVLDTEILLENISLYNIYIYISLKMRAQRPVSAFMSPKVDRTNPCCQQRKQNYPLMSKRKESQKCRFRSEQEMQANIIATKTGLKNLNKTFFPTSNERHRQLRDGCYSYCHQGEQRWGDPLHPDSRTPTI